MALLSTREKAEKAGEDTANAAKVKTQRVRRRLAADDEAVRRWALIGGASALGAGALGLLGWYIFKRRDAIRKSLKDARDTLHEKMEHRKGGAKPPAGAAAS